MKEKWSERKFKIQCLFFGGGGGGGIPRSGAGKLEARRVHLDGRAPKYNEPWVRTLDSGATKAEAKIRHRFSCLNVLCTQILRTGIFRGRTGRTSDLGSNRQVEL